MLGIQVHKPPSPSKLGAMQENAARPEGPMPKIPALIAGGIVPEAASSVAPRQLPPLLTTSSRCPQIHIRAPSSHLPSESQTSSPHKLQSDNLSGPGFTPPSNTMPYSTLVCKVGLAGVSIMAGSCNSCPCLDGSSDLPAPVAGSVTMESIGISTCLGCGHPIWIHRGFVEYSRLQAQASQQAVRRTAPDLYPEGWSMFQDAVSVG